MAHLLHLIRFGFAAFRLEIQDFLYIRAGEDVMTTVSPFIETKSQQQPPQSFKGNIGVGGTAKNLFEKFVRTSHRTELTLKPLTCTTGRKAR